MKPIIIAISGKQGSGKTTLADILQRELNSKGVTTERFKFAGAIYECHDAIYNILTKRGIVLPKKDGSLLQWLGTEYGRSKDPDIWVKTLRADVDSYLRYCSAMNDPASVRNPIDLKPGVIIDDMRFENEFEALPDAFKIRLECPRNIRKARCPAWRDDEYHHSEVGLDKWAAEGKFNLSLNSDVVPVEEEVDWVMLNIETFFDVTLR